MTKKQQISIAENKFETSNGTQIVEEQSIPSEIEEKESIELEETQYKSHVIEIGKSENYLGRITDREKINIYFEKFPKFYIGSTLEEQLTTLFSFEYNNKFDHLIIEKTEVI